MRQTAKILRKLLLDGELDTNDSALLAEYRTPEVRTELDVWGEELGFSLVDMRGKVYLVPHTDSELLSFSIRDIRERESSSARLIDAFLQCYITMTILWMFYGGKNKNPKQAMFLQIKDVVAMLDDRFSNASASEVNVFETEYEINFTHISSHWSAMPVYEDQKRKTRMESVLRACRFMREQQLLLLLDGDREIRPTDRLDDLMMGYYLDMNRIDEIHSLFDSMGVSGQ